VYNSFLSFAIAFVTWFLLLVIFYFAVFKKTEMPPVSITLDAAMISESEQEKKSMTKSAPQEIGNEQIKRQEKVAESTSDSVAKKAIPLFSPLPKIPDDLRDEAFSSFAVARFYIASNGSVTSVELIHPCANPRLNQLLLNSLRNWKFISNAQNYTQDIRVTFQVE